MSSSPARSELLLPNDHPKLRPSAEPSPEVSAPEPQEIFEQKQFVNGKGLNMQLATGQVIPQQIQFDLPGDTPAQAFEGFEKKMNEAVEKAKSEIEGHLRRQALIQNAAAGIPLPKPGNPKTRYR